MLTVEPTQHNWDIYDQLCEIDARFQNSEDPAERYDLIQVAKRLANDLKVN